MGTIFRESTDNIRILAGETKTAFPETRALPRGLTHADIEVGELVGLEPSAGQGLTLQKITAGNEVAQAGNAAMRIDNTRYDTQESGAITTIQGFYVVSTELYDGSATYSVGDYVTAVYDSGVDGGVFGAVEGGTTEDAIGQVQSAPQDPASNTPMRIKVFPNPVDVS